ncbi:hypothetical protein IDG58_04775 [Pelagibacterales bacterium SAG-MED19]|nr:hypothetical protein [Pelagibacterales bacterium SAG-MED19]
MKLKISHHKLTDIINLKLGVYKPLIEFNSKDDFMEIVKNYKTKKKQFFPFPIYFDISSEVYRKVKKEKKLILYFKNTKVCVLKIKNFYKLNKFLIGKKIFKTNDKKHPGFKHFLNTNEYFIHAKIFDFNKKIMKKINFTNPNYIKNIILKKKIKTIAGFHTRNVPHKGHEWIHSFGLSKCDSLLVQPMIGQFRKNEYKDKFILKTNQYLINNVYKRKNVFFGLYNSYPKYGGPREALLHAIVRRNFGCSHFLIGRDHAGVKNYYKKYESQKICKKYEKYLGIKILTFNEPFLCNICKKIKNEKKHGCKKLSIKKISGTYIRSQILKKNLISKFMMRKEIFRMINKGSIIK